MPRLCLRTIDGDHDPSATETAGLIASRLGATVAARANGSQSLLVIGSKLGTPPGRVTVSAAAGICVVAVLTGKSPYSICTNSCYT